MLDAGLGSTAPEIFDIRLHAFPGARSVEQAWPEQAPVPEQPLTGPLKELVDAGRLDPCGAVTIAGRSLGVPSTAVAAAAIQIAQACRAVADGRYCDLIDVGLVDCGRVRAYPNRLTRPGSLPFVEARPAD